MRDKKPIANEKQMALENSHELKMMREIYEKGGLSRREFMQGVVAAGLSAAAAGTFVNASFDIRAATPKRGGRVRWAGDVHGPSDTTDPALFTGGVDSVRGRCHFNNLLQFNDDMTVRAELASEYSSNDDNTEYTFKLRDDVKFHDGSKLSADDVIYSMRRHIGEGAVSTASGLVSDVTAWTKIDSHTVKATLSGPNPDLPSVLGTVSFRIIKNDAENIPGYWDKPNGTGPYLCQEFSPGVRSIHTRNEDYWREPPMPDEVEAFAITDGTARVNALLSGDIELAMAAPPNAYSLIENSENAELFSVEAGPFHNLVLMQDRHPGENQDFVLAIKYLLNRERVVKTFLRGEGAIGNDHPIAQQYPEHCPDIAQRPYDLDKAAFHWKKSGVTTDSLPPLYFGDTDPGMVDTCLMLQRESQKIGMNLPIKHVPSDGYWDLYPKNYAMIGSGWNMRPTANMMYAEVFAGESPNNESIWQNERFNQLLVAARGEKDKGVFMEMHCEMQQLVSDDCATPIPAFRNFIDGKSKNIHGVPRIPLGPLGFHGWPEFVWLDNG